MAGPEGFFHDVPPGPGKPFPRSDFPVCPLASVVSSPKSSSDTLGLQGDLSDLPGLLVPRKRAHEIQDLFLFG